MKDIIFQGDSLDCLRTFPQSVRRETGYQLDKLQQGLDPSDFKPMTTVGAGAYEIRVRDLAGAFRVIYVAKLADGIHVLHAFQKKTQQTSQTDIEIAKDRYRTLTKRGSK